MATITWALEADFDRDGSYETALTDYIDSPGFDILISRGIGRDGRPLSSQMTLTLSNRDGTFTVENSASTLYGKLRPGVPVRLKATYSSTDYTLWTGYAMQWQARFAGATESACTVTCTDLISRLQDAEPVNVTASTTRDTDGALVAIFTALGLTASDYDFDDGVQDLPIHFVVNEYPMDALMAVAASEMGGLLYPKATGELRFEARNSRLGVSPDATWGEGTSVLPLTEEYELNPLEYVTKVSARATVFRSGQADTPIFEFSQNMFTKPTATSMSLAAGEVWERTFQANSAYVALTALDSGYDYTANTAIDGTGTDKTSALTATVTDLGGGRFRLKLVNTDAATIYVTKFRMRGQPVEFFADRSEAEFSLSVSGLKAGRALQFDVPFAGDTGGKLRDYAYQELRVGRYPWPTLRLSFRAFLADDIAAMLEADLGHLVKYASPTDSTFQTASVDDWWYIEALQYKIPAGWAGEVFECSVTLVPSYVYRNLDAIVFDTFDRGNATGDLGTSFSGDAWANDAGFDIVSNAARANTAYPSPARLEVGKTDVVVEVQISNMAGGGSNEWCGVVYRWVDDNNFYLAAVFDQFDTVGILKCVAGTFSTVVDSAWTPTTSAELRLIAQGDRHRLYLDGKLVADADDSEHAGTGIGIFAWAASGTATFENFYGQGLN